MPDTLDPDRVWDVADHLFRELADITEDDWLECDVERWRSSISRAYYAAFLSLKRKMRDKGFPFPDRHAVHKKVADALENGLGAKHRVTRSLWPLRVERGKADYEFDMTVDVRKAKAQLVAAGTTIGYIGDLKDNELALIAAQF